MIDLRSGNVVRTLAIAQPGILLGETARQAAGRTRGRSAPTPRPLGEIRPDRAMPFGMRRRGMGDVERLERLPHHEDLITDPGQLGGRVVVLARGRGHLRKRTSLLVEVLHKPFAFGAVHRPRLCHDHRGCGGSATATRFLYVFYSPI